MKGARSILPRQQGAAPLDVVIAVMAFLAALALGASLIADRMAESWRAGLSGKLTVQILPPDQGPALEGLARATLTSLRILRETPGIAHAAALTDDEQMKLIRPWLGQDVIAKDLPLPQLIDVDITPGATVDATALAARLKAAVPEARLDDHSLWLGRLRDLAGSVIWSAYGILLMIAIATAAAVSFATRAGLQAHHDMVELLHQMGAQASFIAGAFEWYYFRAALIAGFCGAALAGLVFLGAGTLQSAGVEAVPFLPPLALQPIELTWLFLIPAGTALIGLMTARLSVLAALSRIY
jgi:cell division transport system permease protein